MTGYVHRVEGEKREVFQSDQRLHKEIMREEDRPEYLNPERAGLRRARVVSLIDFHSA